MSQTVNNLTRGELKQRLNNKEFEDLTEEKKVGKGPNFAATNAKRRQVATYNWQITQKSKKGVELV